MRKATGRTLEAELEEENRGFVSRDVVEPRRQLANDGEMVANNLSLLLQRVSVHSAQEIDGLIRDLTMLRERTRNYGWIDWHGRLLFSRMDWIVISMIAALGLSMAGLVWISLRA